MALSSAHAVLVSDTTHTATTRQQATTHILQARASNDGCGTAGVAFFHGQRLHAVVHLVTKHNRVASPFGIVGPLLF